MTVFKFRSFLFSLVFILLSESGSASETLSNFFKNGDLSGYVKTCNVLYGKDNGFDPRTGCSIGGKLKYETGIFKGFKAGIAFYTAGDTGLTNEHEKIAHGLFLSTDLDFDTILGEAFIEYRISKSFLRFGRQELNTPMTREKVSIVPNLYTAGSLTVRDIPDAELMLLHIEEMAFGSRSMADYGLIGEYTHTAGAAISPKDLRGEFISAEDMTGTAEKTSGITVMGAVYRGIPNTSLQLWDYMAHDIQNIIYAQADYKIRLNSLTAEVAAQILKEQEIGDKLAGLDANTVLWGVKGSLAFKSASIYVAFNSNRDGRVFNPWGGDPAFTSTIFSRNAYRSNVDAYMIGGKYNIMKGLSIGIECADYGKSDTKGGNKSTPLDPSDSATEVDISLTYKPIKDLTLKAFSAFRTSEYDRDGSGGNGDTQNHFRLIALVTF